MIYKYSTYDLRILEGTDQEQWWKIITYINYHSNLQFIQHSKIIDVHLTDDIQCTCKVT